MSVKTLLVKHVSGDPSVTPDGVRHTLKAETAPVPVACLNWPQFPYRPEVDFRIGHIQTEIWLLFHVREERTRGLETQINGAVHKDSGVEFFFSFDKNNYYNFECNCIGTPHFAYGPGRENRQLIPPSLIDQIVIDPSLGRQPFTEKSGGFDWTLTVKIPAACLMFHTISALSGVQATANFYKVGSGMSVPHYLSWSPVATPRPDYHRPEFFGDLRFE